MTGTEALDNLIFTLTQISERCPVREVAGLRAAIEAAKTARSDVTEEAHYKHLAVPKDRDGAYRVHGRLDGKNITSPEQQQAVRDLMARGLMA